MILSTCMTFSRSLLKRDCNCGIEVEEGQMDGEEEQKEGGEEQKEEEEEEEAGKNE